MYEQFFGFTRKPFNVTANPRCLFMTDSHQEALASLVYGILERRGFISISGEIGTGKTTLLNYLRRILGEKIKTIFIFQTHISFEDLLKEILRELDLPIGDGSKISMIHQFNIYLLKTLERKENLAILIDEAQNLSNEVLEELRMLSNMEAGEAKLLQIVLVGQLELEKKLNSEGLRQLRQRIGIRRQIRPLSKEETRAYIEQRLKEVESSNDEIFTPEALDLICRYTAGIFRNINILCDNAFLIGYGLKKNKIDDDIVREVLGDMGIVAPRESLQPKKVYSPEAVIYRHSQSPSERNQLEYINKESQPRRWRTIPLILGTLAFGLVLYLGWIFFLTPAQHSNSNRLAPVASDSEAKERNESKSEPRQAPVSDSKTANKKENPKKIKPESNAKGKGEVSFNRIIEVPEGETFYTLVEQYYPKANPTIMDYILESNPLIGNIHLIFAKQRIIIPEIHEESLLMGERDGTWKVHLGTFISPDSAGMYKGEPGLRGKEINIIERRVSPRDTWYRVYAEKLDSKEEGLKLVQELKKKGRLPALKRKD